MTAQLDMTMAELEAWMVASAQVREKAKPWQRTNYTHVKARAPAGWRAGTKTVEVEGLGRGLVGYEQLDGTLHVRFHVRRVEDFLAKAKTKGLAGANATDRRHQG